jgi:transcriptional regulator with XRE-family HTH domain
MATIDVRSLGEYIREQRTSAEVSLRQLAKSAGVSNPYLSQVERGLKKPSAEILGQIAGALRISAETLYVRAGLLEARDGDAAVTEAITDRQRQVLLEIYAAFQKENAVIREATTTSPDGVGAPTTGTADVTTS